MSIDPITPPAVISVIDNATTRLAQAAMWLTLAMVLITVAIVILRYAFEIGAIPLQESVMYMHGIVFLIGIPYGVRQNTHVRVDIIYARLTPRHQTLVDLFGHVMFLLPLASFIAISSWPYTLASWRVLEGSAEVGGIPAVFLLKTLIPIAAVLLLAQSVAEILKKILMLRT